MRKTTTNYRQNHSTYAGEITLDDFDTNSPNKNRIDNYRVADNLQNDLRDKLKKSMEKKKSEEKYMRMTLEELREMKIISNTNGRPSSTLTDERWQKEFDVRKFFVKPDKTRKLMCGRYSKESGMWNGELQGEYYGATNYQEYCAYINDVLRNIRDGITDYCYFIYQIMDLLRFEYENLRTKYCDGYWEVWLEK